MMKRPSLTLPGLALLFSSIAFASPAGAAGSTPAAASATTFVWSRTGTLQKQRFDHAGSLLLDGRVLLTGGDAGRVSTQTAEVYNPASGEWALTGNMSTVRYFHTSTTLLNGKVLIVGGRNDDALPASCELYDPATGTFTLQDSESDPYCCPLQPVFTRFLRSSTV